MNAGTADRKPFDLVGGVARTNLVFVVNDLELGDAHVNAEDIADTLLAAGCWLYGPTAPHVRRLQGGDKVLVYLAGASRRYFCASFMLSGPVESKKPCLSGTVGDLLTRTFSASSPITGVRRWVTPVHIKPLIQDLQFITDKKNWGLHFRQSVRVIGEEDHDRICREGNAVR